LLYVNPEQFRNHIKVSNFFVVKNVILKVDKTCHFKMSPTEKEKRRRNKARVVQKQQSKVQHDRRMAFLNPFSMKVAIAIAIVGMTYSALLARQGVCPIMKELRFVCHTNNNETGYCHHGLQDYDRSHRAKLPISPKSVLLRIPRSVQLWDLDALRALAITKPIRNLRTDRPLDGGAYLALYLWKRFVKNYDQNDPLRSYYYSFPTNLTYHPVFWSEQKLQKHLNLRSHAYAVARAYRDMVHSEYQAVREIEPDLPMETYQGFRVIVLSRSFGTGPPGEDEGTSQIQLAAELEGYNQTLGVDLSLGCRAMVPILDMYNHHANPNLAWRYENREFVITALRRIEKHHVLYDSYGTYTDSHLFAKFGFQNGDGSAPTDASIAVLHRLMDVGLQQQFTYLPNEESAYHRILESQKVIMARYLQFDDGYAKCIGNSDSIPYKLKQVKLQHLLRIAHDPKRWIVHMPPRNPKASPHDDIPDRAPSFHRKFFPGFDASRVMSTCRLIVLTEHDFVGNALRRLEEHLLLETDGIDVPYQTDTLEYRALMCLARLAGIALQSLNLSSAEAVQTFADSITAEAGIHSPTWTTHQVLVGEIRSLEMLSHMAATGASPLASKIDGELPTIRRQPCEWNDTKRLAEKTRVV
jgi:SET domain